MRLWTIGLLTVLMMGCGKLPVPAPREAARAVTSAEGDRLYQSFCAACHGEDGRGQTVIGQQLEPPPGDFSRCNFKYRSTPSGTLPTRSDLLRTLHVGIPGTGMPGFSSPALLPALSALVASVQQRCVSFKRQPPGASIPAPRRAGAYTSSSVQRGRGIYRREQCRSCHGVRGRGDGPVAGALKDALGRAVKPRDFTREVLRSGSASVDIYRALSTGLDGTPMPALMEALPERERWDLTHYVLWLHQGKGPLWRVAATAPAAYRRLSVWGAR